MSGWRIIPACAVSNLLLWDSIHLNNVGVPVISHDIDVTTCCDAVVFRHVYAAVDVDSYGCIIGINQVTNGDKSG